ncbi:KRAB-A domain-containing protein 2-like [Aphis craccivora]|uniref:KRAB-A domain-containing protein 2-like n=1 Tax=Aphis craccivora TaxID=307492 RepID=A0A6G0ZNG0_APHCR|nr:KRAB-A domain-containing protein 2-like [Aphis craccivora]
MLPSMSLASHYNTKPILCMSFEIKNHRIKIEDKFLNQYFIIHSTHKLNLTLFTCKDNITKCVLFRSLKSKYAKKSAFIVHMIDVFITTFNVKAILHPDNRREFLNTGITEFNVMWSNLKIVHDKSSHNQS